MENLHAYSSKVVQNPRWPIEAINGRYKNVHFALITILKELLLLKYAKHTVYSLYVGLYDKYNINSENNNA